MRGFIIYQVRGFDLANIDIVVTDGNLITATGLAALEFSYEVFKKTDVIKPETLEAWYQLNKTRDVKYFYALMDSLK